MTIIFVNYEYMTTIKLHFHKIKCAVVRQLGAVQRNLPFWANLHILMPP